MAESSSQSPSGPFKQVVHLVMAVLVILYLAKVYLRDPEYRHIEVCYMPYKVAHLFWVGAWGAVVTDDTASLLKHSRDLTRFYNACSEEVGTWTWLRTLGTNP